MAKHVEPSRREPEPARDRGAILRLSVLFGTIYFVQGVSEPSEGLIAQPVRSLLKEWGLSAGAITSFVALLALPWSIKPLFGLVTDFVPLFGWRRKSWLVVASALACLGLLVTWLAPIPAGARWLLLGLLLLPTAGVAFADVIADALMVEKGQPLQATGRLQSVQWACIYAATILTGVTGGYLAQHGLQRLGFLICGLVAIATLVVAIVFVREPRYERPRGSPREAWRALRRAGRQPAVLAAGGFLFLLRWNPFSSTVLYLYLTKRLAISEQLYGWLSSAVAVASIAGAILYGLVGRRLPVRPLIHGTIAVGVLGTLCWWGVAGPRSAFAIAVLVGFCTMVAHLVQLDLAARSCATETAGTVFALLMALSNLSMSTSTWAGGWIYERLTAGYGARVAFDLLVLIGALCTAACWPLLWGVRRRGQPLIDVLEEAATRWPDPDRRARSRGLEPLNTSRT